VDKRARERGRDDDDDDDDDDGEGGGRGEDVARRPEWSRVEPTPVVTQRPFLFNCQLTGAALVATIPRPRHVLLLQSSLLMLSVWSASRRVGGSNISCWCRAVCDTARYLSLSP